MSVTRKVQRNKSASWSARVVSVAAHPYRRTTSGGEHYTQVGRARCETGTRIASSKRVVMSVTAGVEVATLEANGVDGTQRDTHFSVENSRSQYTLQILEKGHPPIDELKLGLTCKISTDASRCGP